MKYIVEMPKSVEQAVADLQAAVQRHKCGCSAHSQPTRNAEEERRGFSQFLSDPQNMQPSKG